MANNHKKFFDHDRDENTDKKEFITETQFDSWGRATQIIYPDKEKVHYIYNKGGMVEAMKGEKEGFIPKDGPIPSSITTTTYDYMLDIRYNEFGQKVYEKLGNGVESHYTYDENRRWLTEKDTDNQMSTSTDKYQFQNMSYSFDLVGNILDISNDLESIDPSKASALQIFQYDELYRLTNARGFVKTAFSPSNGNNSEKNSYTVYEQHYDFNNDDIHNMKAKNSAVNKKDFKDLSSDMTFTDLENATVGADIASLSYTLSFSFASAKPHAMTGDSENTYSYDAGGNLKSRISSTKERTLNWDSQNRLTTVDDNGTKSHYDYNAGGQRARKYTGSKETVYVNSLFIVSDYHQAAKHYYIGGSRSNATIISDIEDVNILDRDLVEEKMNQFYYHSDHLGSSNYITDSNGAVYEHVEYMPYGEVYEERPGNDNDVTNFKFTGKELDVETGLYFYGARYMDPRTSRFVSVDPLYVQFVNPDAEANLYSYARHNCTL